jgi:hypothetical protein
VPLLRPLQQRRLPPRRAVEDRRGVGRGSHWLEVSFELLFVDVLGLVHLEQQARRVPDDVRAGLCRHEDLPRAADAHDVPGFDRHRPDPRRPQQRR